MALPSVKNATFTIKVQEFQKPIKIRPMILAEHKAIQMSTDVGQESDVALTIANVTASCTDGLVTAQSVPQYLLDFVFLQLYISSVENVINSRYRCYGHLKDEEGNLKYDEETKDPIVCDNSIEVKIPLDMATIIYPEEFNDLKVIQITDTVKLHLKSLSLQNNLDVSELRVKIVDIINEIDEISIAKEEGPDEADKAKIKELTDKLIGMRQEIKDLYFYYSVDHIEDADNIYKPETDFNLQEFLEWSGNCPSASFNRLEDFYQNVPTVGMDLHIQCPKCGNKSDTKLRGLKDFFS
jgi:hypothetical protein